MSHPSNCPYHSKVGFETPMETNRSTFSSEAGMLVNVSRPCFNLGMSLPVAQPPPVPRFDFGMDLDLPMVLPSAAPPMLKFNFGMNLSIPVAMLPASPAVHTQQPFNLGFALAQPTQQPAPMPFIWDPNPDEVHEGVLPAVESLLDEVGRAEAGSGKETGSGEDTEFSNEM
ncbi:hypothetical protein BDR05DRAFT_952306 [Suillus weaverae]|nr:hypothetical protein BDR05DRAFT_952306 [Suillus weaverae]